MDKEKLKKYLLNEIMKGYLKAKEYKEQNDVQGVWDTLLIKNTLENLLRQIEDGNFD